MGNNLAMVNGGNFITIQGWMVSELGLNGNELLCYALIYGFSQDGQSVFSGTLKYICEWLNVSKQTAITTIKKLCEKGLICKVEKNVNGVSFYDYRASQKFLQGVKNFDWGGQNSLPGGQNSLPHNIKDNIRDNINNPYILTDIVPLKEKRFKKPTKDEVEEYINETGYYADAEQFIAYYDSVGWKVGKNPMKDWKSALRGWAIRDRKRVYDKPKPKALSKAQEIDRKNLEYLKEMLGGE